jgi:hypothetical protein
MPRRKPFRMIQQALQARARGATNAEAAEPVGVATMTVIRWGRLRGSSCRDGSRSGMLPVVVASGGLTRVMTDFVSLR